MRGIKKRLIIIDNVKYIHIFSKKKEDENSWNRCEHFVKNKMDEPICWDDKCLLSRKFYYNGKLHRDDGPAHITYDETFTTEERIVWYNHGFTMTDEESKNLKRKINLNKMLS